MDCEKKKNVKRVEVNFLPDCYIKISNNLILFYIDFQHNDKERCVHLFDFNKYQVIRSITVFKPKVGDEGKQIKVVSLVYKNIVVICHEDKTNDNYKQYKVLKDNLDFVVGRSMGYLGYVSMPRIKGLKNKRFVITDYFKGNVFVLS